MMKGTMKSLEEEVLAVFDRACCEQDLEVAEHLLQTLEVMARRAGNEEWLDDVYLRLGKLKQ